MVSELKLLGQESVMLNSPDIKNLFSDFRRNVQAFGTPWWISDLLTVADEVRDRTIFVKIKSQLHSWTDLEIKYLFSEFGMIEEVTYLPEVSGFHSRVRFQTIYDSEWAYYYYGDGRFAHHGCCEIEMHRADDAIRWNDERNTEIKIAYGSSDTHVMMDSECLTGELLMNEEMLNQVEESIGDSAKKKLNVVKETSDLIAHQVLEEMPKSIVTHEVKFLDEIGKKNDELVDGFGLKAPPIGSVKRLDDVKALEEGKPRDAIPTIHALKLDFSEQARMMNGIVKAICFDPGGTDLTHGDLAISLPNGNYESDAGEEKELIQVEGSEPVAVKDISDFIAHHVLDNMPSRETELMTELSRDNDTLNQQKLVVRVPAVPESKWDKKLDAIELLKVVDISTNGGLVTSLPNGAEKTTNELVTAEHELEVATAQEKIGMGCIETLCFDPGGSLLPVDTSIRTKLTEISILVGSSSFPLREDPCLDWIAYRKAEKFEFICTHLLENGDLLLRRIVLQLIRAYKRNDKPQLVAAAKFIAHLVNQMVCHELIDLELLETLLAQPTDDSVEVDVGFVTECGAILQDLSPMGPSERRLYVQGKEINGAGINSSFATMYAHWVASLTLAEFWITQIYGFVFDPGGEVAGVLCEKSSVDCDLSYYWCLSSAEWVQAAELVKVQAQAAATSTDDIVCQVPLPQLIEDKIVYIYETLSTQVGDMGLRSKWAYVDPVYFVALSGILDLIITSSIFIFDSDEACSTVQD